MIASLMMYARPELQGAHDRLWAAIRRSLGARGIEAPATLSQVADPYTVWRARDLVLSQTCGMPFRTRLHSHVHLVGTPDYGLPGCAEGQYNSVIVVRRDETAQAAAEMLNRRAAYNDPLSQSGFAAFYAHLGGRWFAQSVQSGGHVASARMVATGAADIAAIDAQTWRSIERFDAFAKDLRVIDRTRPTPGLPLITGLTQDAGSLFAAVQQAIRSLDERDAAALDLRGIVQIPAAAYLAVPTPPHGVLR